MNDLINQLNSMFEKQPKDIMSFSFELENFINQNKNVLADNYDVLSDVFQTLDQEHGAGNIDDTEYWKRLKELVSSIQINS
jgi:hypothetical protein